jgi:hypothetical protein
MPFGNDGITVCCEFYFVIVHFSMDPDLALAAFYDVVICLCIALQLSGRVFPKSIMYW